MTNGKPDMEPKAPSGGKKISHPVFQREMRLQINADGEMTARGKFKPLPDATKNVGVMMVEHLNSEDRVAWPGLRRLADLCFKSPAIVHKHVRRLVAQGHFRE